MQPNLFSNFGLVSHLTTEGKTSIQITTFVTRQDQHLTIPLREWSHGLYSLGRPGSFSTKIWSLLYPVMSAPLFQANRMLECRVIFSHSTVVFGAGSTESTRTEDNVLKYIFRGAMCHIHRSLAGQMGIYVVTRKAPASASEGSP